MNITTNAPFPPPRRVGSIRRAIAHWLGAMTYDEVCALLLTHERWLLEQTRHSSGMQPSSSSPPSVPQGTCKQQPTSSPARYTVPLQHTRQTPGVPVRVQPFDEWMREHESWWQRPPSSHR